VAALKKRVTRRYFYSDSPSPKLHPVRQDSITIVGSFHSSAGMTFKIRHLLLLVPACIAWASPAEAPLPAKPEPAASAAASSESKPGDDSKASRDYTQDVMLQALSLIGVTYRWGGNSPTTGLDCSGFIRYVFQQTLNIALPHNAFAMSRLGDDVDKEGLKPGDLVFFNTLGRKFSHVGIYLGDDRFIHSPSAGSKIQIVSLKDAYWMQHYNGARRLTQESIAERTPKLAQLMAEERATESSGSGKKHGHKVSKKKHK